MKGYFKYCGRYNDKDYIEIKLDDGSGLKQAGIDIRYHYFSIDIKNNEIKKISYNDVGLAKINTEVHHVNGKVTKSISDKVTKKLNEDYFHYFKKEYFGVLQDGYNIKNQLKLSDLTLH